VSGKKESKEKGLVSGVKADVDISQHIKKALNTVKSMVSKLEELSLSKKKLSPENKVAIGAIREIMEKLNI
jgi:hypothetical protein